jgi:hypothetical protein
LNDSFKRNVFSKLTKRLERPSRMNDFADSNTLSILVSTSYSWVI